MIRLNPLLVSIAILASVTLPASVCAQDAAPLKTDMKAEVKAEMTAGEIRKVDKEASKITIKHSEIKSFDMPAMTMVFTVKDPALLEKAKPGDKVKFVVVREEGKFVVTDIQPEK